MIIIDVINVVISDIDRILFNICSFQIGDIDLYKESKPAKGKHKSSDVSVSNKKLLKREKRKLDD